MNINFATATPAQLAAAGYNFRKMPTTARRTRKSLYGVKPTANKKGCKKYTADTAPEASTGTIRN